MCPRKTGIPGDFGPGYFDQKDKDGVGMSRSQLVAEHLPLLRRYARALTGNQASGDAYVGAMLEALLQDSSLLDEQHGSRAGLFRLFTQIWNSVALNDNADVATLSMPPERRLSNITPLPRQAFLLLSLEGFSEEEVAFILGTDVAETRKLADAAGREMAAEIATDVLIIEDETFIAMDLESLVRNLGHNVIGVARTHSHAVATAPSPARAPNRRSSSRSRSSRRGFPRSPARRCSSSATRATARLGRP